MISPSAAGGCGGLGRLQKVRDRKLAALTHAVRKVCSAIYDDREAVPDDGVGQLVAARDRAIILPSYRTALPSGELVSIDSKDLIEVDVASRSR
jgi:hypothetical protein